ncbi:MAG: hypothetical protein NTX32_07795 [Candidatus Firestonebacteria bacterium]|nr:hypothetical protein [Candidatus Firestonebacteria bacterium]
MAKVVEKAAPAKKAAFGGKVIKWSKVKDVKIGEIFDNKDCGMGEIFCYNIQTKRARPAGKVSFLRKSNPGQEQSLKEREPCIVKTAAKKYLKTKMLYALIVKPAVIQRICRRNRSRQRKRL